MDTESEIVIEEPARNLPEPVGIRKAHKDLAEELIERVISVLRAPERKLANYSVRDEEYIQQIRECFSVIANGSQVTIEIQTKKDRSV